jgi:hypothetical protein
MPACNQSRMADWLVPMPPWASAKATWPAGKLNNGEESEVSGKGETNKGRKVRSWTVAAWLVAIVATSGLLFVPQQAQAYRLTDYGYKTKSPLVSMYYLPSAYRTALKAACTAWKSSSVGVNPTTMSVPMRN